MVNDSVKDLKAVLKREKAKGKFQGNISTMRKNDLLSAVTQLGYSVSVGAKATSTRRPRKTKTTRVAGGSLAAKPKMFGPSLARGMTYKRLVDSYAKSGNTQLAAVLPSVVAAAAPKRRGRPRKAANPLVYDMASGVYVKAANVLPSVAVSAAPKRRGRPPKATAAAPKMFGPSLGRGMTYKRLYDSYVKSGNTQLAAVLPSVVVRPKKFKKD